MPVGCEKLLHLLDSESLERSLHRVLAGTRDMSVFIVRARGQAANMWMWVALYERTADGNVTNTVRRICSGCLDNVRG